MDSMDTTELGAGMNPTPNELEKCFKLKCECLVEVIFDVWAENLEKAEQYLNNRNYEEKQFEDIVEIGRIIDFEEE